MQYPLRHHQWSRAEYDRRIEVGVFKPGTAVELLGGALIVAEPQSSAHYTAIRLVENALQRAFGDEWQIRTQGPIALDEESEPEPDIAVAAGSIRDYGHEHPERPVLVGEVAVSSLSLDRDHKGSLYARAGLADYWILNLIGRALEVYREPIVDAAAAFGWRYGSARTLGTEASVVPLAAPDALIRVADLLP